MGVARVSRRHDAVEHIDSAPHRLDDVLRPPDAHQIARLVRGHQGREALEHLAALSLALAHRKAAYAQAREADVLERRERCLPQVPMYAALHDAKQGTRGFA